MRQHIEKEIKRFENEIAYNESREILYESDVRTINRNISELKIRLETLKSILSAHGDIEIEVVKKTKVRRTRPQPFSGGGLDDSTESFESGYDKGFSDAQRILRAAILKKIM